MKRRLASLLGLGLLTATGAAQATITPTMFVDPAEKLTEPAGFMTKLGATFPESVHIGALFLSSIYNPDLLVTAATKIRLSYLSQGASFRNTLGYFTWTTDGEAVTVVDRQLIFPDCSGASLPLSLGDTVTLRDAAGDERVFQPGEQVGFFLVANGWNGSGVTGWDEANPALPSTTPAANETSGSHGVAQGVLTSVDGLNPENSEGHPELARHVVMLQMDDVPGALSGQALWVMGFEDTLRTRSGCDNDFNDVMFQIQAFSGPSYETADNTPIGTSRVPSYDVSNPDPDGDGVEGLSDYFPNDPERAFVVSTPSSGFDTLAFEDLYPHVGDADFNDAVFQYAIDEVLSASNDLKQIQGTYYFIARGAGLDHHFGLAIHGVPSTSSGTIEIERFTPDGVESRAAAASIASMIQQDASGEYMLRIDDLIESTRAALPPLSHADGGSTNTWTAVPDSRPAAFRFVVTFDSAIATAPLGAPPWDPYLSAVHSDGLYDIHRPGMQGLPGRPASLPAEEGADSFLDEHGYPFLLFVPYDFRYPLEGVNIAHGGRGMGIPYTQFDAWRTSAGATNSTWFSSPATRTPACVIEPIGQDVRTSPWTLTIAP